MSNVVSFNGVPLPQWVKVTGLSFPVLPEVEVREATVPRRYGNIDNGVKFGGKSISLSVMLQITEQDNLHDRADELKAWLRGDNWKPSKLVFDEQPNKYLLARVSESVSVEDMFYIGSGDIEFYSANPIKYDVEETEISGNSAGVEVPYSGMELAPTVITVEVVEDCIDLSVTHKQSGKQILLRGNFKTGQIVSIDSSRKLVKVDGSNAMRLLDFESQWLYVESGNNTFTGGSLTEGVDNIITVKYRKAD